MKAGRQDNRTAGPDVDYMRRCLELAERGRGLTSPGAMVGAVIVRNGDIVGEGFYTYDGVDHAEVRALRHAGTHARGGTAYVNLEPCSHTGRTPPCADALIDAGIARVVAAMEDPNPAVCSGGFRRLRDAGVHVECGVLEPEARRLNEAFVTCKSERRPFGLLKLAMTFDGKIATSSGESRWITSEQSRAIVQRLRHGSDALVTGSGTVLADDPRLTDRSGLPRRRPLVRVVLDRRGRLHSGLKLFESGHVVVFTESHSLRLPAEVVTGPCDLGAVVANLRERELQSFLMECGPDLACGALRAGIIDKIVAFIAPKILGGREVPAIGAEGARALRDAIALEGWAAEPAGPDLMVTAYVHRDH